MEVDDGGTPNVDQMNEKDRKKWEKNLASWRIFMDFILRHVSIVTFKYNCFEHDELLDFFEACDRGEMLRKSTKLKKSESPEINSFKVMRECADLLAAQNFIEESNIIRRFLDIMARVKCISAIGTGFYKALKKGNVKGLEKLQYYVDYWKGFCSRNYDYRELAFLNTSHELFSELESRFLAFPTAVRTSINMSQRFLKQASESTGLELLTTDQRTMEKHMQAAEMVLATHLEQALFNRVMADSKTLMNPGLAALLGKQDSGPSHPFWELPKINIEPELLLPISDRGPLLELPPEPPKDKKGKKGKKGGGGGGKKKKK